MCCITTGARSASIRTYNLNACAGYVMCSVFDSQAHQLPLQHACFSSSCTTKSHNEVVDDLPNSRAALVREMHGQQAADLMLLIRSLPNSSVHIKQGIIDTVGFSERWVSSI